MKKSQFIAIVIMFVVASVLIWVGAFGKDVIDTNEGGDSVFSGTVPPAETSVPETEPPEGGVPTEEVPVVTEAPTEDPETPVVFPTVSNENYSNVENTFHYWSSYFKEENNQFVPSLDHAIYQAMAEDMEVVDYIFLNDVFEGEREVYLTFTLHYDYGVTGDILDTLKSNNVKATFFVTEKYIRDNPDLVKRMKAEGHVIGSRGPDPENIEERMEGMSAEEFAAELLKVEKAYQELFGETERMKYCRLDYFSSRTLKVAEDMGYTLVFKTYNTNSANEQNDWASSGYDTEYIMWRMTERALYDGSVPEFAVSKEVYDALDSFLKETASGNVVFKLLGETP